MPGHRNRTKRQGLDSPRAFWVFVAFALLVFLMGGGSRYDIESVGPLRALSVLVAAVALYFHRRETLREFVVPLALLAMLATWMAIQLFPLPKAVWIELPGRSTIAELGDLIGSGGVSRPLSLSPMRTANALASLTVPVASLLLLALLDADGLRRVRTLVVALGVASALLGILQILLPGARGLYLYDVTNTGDAVGLFSNRNHNALFVNIALLFSIFGSKRQSSERAKQGRFMFAAGQLAMVIGIFVNASRVGLVLLALISLIWLGRKVIFLRSAKRTKAIPSWQIGLGAVIAVAAFSTLALSMLLGRLPALERMIEKDPSQDLRAEALPYTIQMAMDYFPYGTGFGTFEHAFRAIEPDHLLSPRYLNQAHNDWLQIVIEGGLPAVLIVVLALGALAKRGWESWRQNSDSERMMRRLTLGFLTLFLFLAHSVVDYPLRTPSLMLVATIAVALVFSRPPPRVTG